MKKIVVSIQNGLLAEAITRMLGESGAFWPFRVQVDESNNIVNDCEALSADILLMEVPYAGEASVATRIEEGKKVKERVPGCKIALLCDENAAPDIAREVTNAKKNGLIDTFFYSSVTSSYLSAALDAL